MNSLKRIAVLIMISLMYSLTLNANTLPRLLKFLSKPSQELGTFSSEICEEPIILQVTPRSKGDKHYFNMKCRNFLDDKGNYGEYGKIIQAYIKKKGAEKSRFFNDKLPGLTSDPKTCPGWKNFSPETKMKFWVWTFAAIAQVESSCDTTKVNKGQVPDPTDRPRGLLQLNTLKSKRSWRGPNCKFPSGHEAVTNPKNNLLCGMDIMNELLKGKDGEYRSNGKIFPTNSYWEKLRKSSSNGGPIGILIRQFPGC